MAARIGDQGMDVLTLTALSALDQTLDDTGVTPGTYGDSTHVGQFTVQSDGRLSSAANVAIATSAGWFPLVDGAEPPAFITDGAGVLIAVAYSP